MPNESPAHNSERLNLFPGKAKLRTRPPNGGKGQKKARKERERNKERVERQSGKRQKKEGNTEEPFETPPCIARITRVPKRAWVRAAGGGEVHP